MAFNVVNLKHREAKEMWLHVKDSDGEPMYADDKKKKPVRIKFKSIHSEVFRRQYLIMSAKLSRITKGKEEEYKALAESGDELDKEKVQSDVLEMFVRADDEAINFIVEMAIDWEGFVDENNKSLAFEPESLQFLLLQIDNYHVLKQIRESFKNSEDFILAQQKPVFSTHHNQDG